MNKLLSSVERYTQTAPRQSSKLSLRGISQLVLMLCALIGFAESAWAVPSYARQTGYPCTKCHVGGFGPQLTPYGIRFKINGYTETDHKGFKIPVAAMVMTGFSHTQTDQASPPTPHRPRLFTKKPATPA